jgi:hypothetical protein
MISTGYWLADWRRSVLTLPRSLLALALAAAGFGAGYALAPRNEGPGASLPANPAPALQRVDRVPSTANLIPIGPLPRLGSGTGP